MNLLGPGYRRVNLAVSPLGASRNSRGILPVLARALLGVMELFVGGSFRFARRNFIRKLHARWVRFIAAPRFHWRGII